MRRKPNSAKEPVDLSFIFTDSDLDRAQERFGELPPELVRHFAAAFAHAAGRGPHPGFYSGRRPRVYDDDEEE